MREYGNKKIKCSFCVCAHNEAENIGRLLNRIIQEKTCLAEIIEIIVVASGCTDNTLEIIEAFKGCDKRIIVIIQKERKGKAVAINEILKIAKGEVIILESADTLPGSGAIDRLIAPFFDNGIGMVGAHPIPVNRFSRNNRNFMAYVGYLQWWFHDRVSQINPKIGELAAFRNVLSAIPEETPVDEATIESLIVSKRYRLYYSRKAYVYNKTPEKIKEFIIQRERIHIGHRYLFHKYKYRVSTCRTGIIVKIISIELCRNLINLCRFLISGKFSLFFAVSRKMIKILIWFFGAGFLEMFAHFLATIDYHKKDSFAVWVTAKTTKNPVFILYNGRHA